MFNPDAARGEWQIDGQRQRVYAKKALPFHDQIKAARKLGGTM